jgi:hypothetical protein
MFGFRKLIVSLSLSTPNSPKMTAILGEFGVVQRIQQCSKSMLNECGRLTKKRSYPMMKMYAPSSENNDDCRTPEDRS